MTVSGGDQPCQRRDHSCEVIARLQGGSRSEPVKEKAVFRA